MTCSSCGKNIPFAGKVCPFCHVDKSSDQQTHLLATVGGIGGALGGSYFFGFWGAVGGFFVGIFAGMVIVKKLQPPK